MNPGYSKLYAKVVDLTKTDWTQIGVPELSEKVCQLIAESRVPSLQVLLVHDTQEDLQRMLENYWSRE